MKKHIVRIALGLAITLFFIGHAAKYYNVPFITQLDDIIYDARLRLTMPGGVDERIVILDIDEKSLEEVGRWPWPRDRLAELVEKLFGKYQAAIVGFDVVFAEPDYSSGIRVLDRLAQGVMKDVPQFRQQYAELRPALDYDALFARAIKGKPVVFGYYLNSEKDAKRTGAIPGPVLPKGTFRGRNIPFTTWTGYGGNLPEFLENAAGAGHFNPITDPDGVVRRVPLIAELDGAYYEALSLAMVRTILGFPKVEPGYAPDRFLQRGYSGLEWLQVGELAIPVDETASALIPYRGHQRSFAYVSLADVLAERMPADRLKGRIALVGTTAPGLKDLRSTPVDSVYPGVEVHANLIAGMLDRKVKLKPPYMLGAEVVLLLIGGVALSLLIPLLAPLWATLLTVAGMSVIAGMNVAVWTQADMVLPLAASVLMTAALYTVNMAYGYFVEARSKRQFTELFGQYVPPELVDEMARDPQKYNMEPRAAELTILFSDVRGFTSISEALKPEELREYINEYLTAMSGIIRSQHRGTLDKYIGDAIMAFWGAPVEDAQHARNAVLAALDMQKEREALNARFAARGWPTLNIGVGLNSGNVRVGDMGSRVRRAYTVMGDPVNVASRLEGRTKGYGVGILVGESTRSQVKDVVFREVDRIKVKGKDEAVTIYEPLGLESEVDRKRQEELKLWNQALRAYRAQAWDQVEVGLLNLRRMNPHCSLYAVYEDRVAAMRRSPPPAGWDGVTAYDEK
ncbi:MAG TPA: adenylate/guanylate cyclase domain-containing protein [Burkholderiales bacterium]|nr:adenylate/guanylate cyclase domain-containing protein [Burkholderiales bacterium]